MTGALQWVADRPPMQHPVLVVMLGGWIDAGGAAAGAMEAIAIEAEAKPLVRFDDDEYVDYRARRPVMELRDGLNTLLQWSEITLATGHDQTGHDLLLLSGPEPDMRWHQFAASVGDLAVELGVSSMVALGAYPFAAPHTRPPRLSVSTASADVLARVPFLRSSVDVPAGIAAVLEHELHDRGIPALGVWVQVPHYIAAMSYPAASVALLDGLREAADVVIDGVEVRQASLAQLHRLDELVAGNPEHQRMVDQLEQLYDSTQDETAIPGPSTLRPASGDELAAELEQFLRNQD